MLLDDGSGEAGVGAPSPALRQWQQLDDGWFGPLRQALAARSVAAATLVLPWGDRTLTVTMTAAGFAVGWRRWRRWIGGRPPAATPVASALAPWLQ